MPQFWLDANVMIEAHRGPYGFDIAPGFWDAIEVAAKDGLVKSPMKVLLEVSAGKDEVAKWAAELKRHLFVDPDADVQINFRSVVEAVRRKYPETTSDSRRFIGGADPWVIAHALAGGRTVVTQERMVAPDSRKVKIPNICEELGIPWMGTYDMLRVLKVVLRSS